MFVTGVGVRSPFGFDARQTALALRSEMFAPRPASWRSERAHAFLSSHRCAYLDDSLEGDARLVELALPALREAVGTTLPESAALVLALAEPRGSAPRVDQLTRRVADEAGLRIERSRSAALRAGHAGLAMALARASTELDTGARVVIVGCIDSYHEEAQFRFLDEEARLLGPHAHNGIVPSEAAVFFVVTRDAPARGAWCTVEHVGAAFEPEATDWTTSTFAETSTTLLHRAAEASRERPFPWVLNDVSNERHRVKEWTALQIRCREALDTDQTVLTRLAEHSGDVGAASGGLALAYACAAWRWGFAPAGRALISLQSEGRERGVLVAHAPGSETS